MSRVICEGSGRREGSKRRNKYETDRARTPCFWAKLSLPDLIFSPLRDDAQSTLASCAVVDLQRDSLRTIAKKLS